MKNTKVPASEYCNDYYCAGDCGLKGHGVQHMTAKTTAERQQALRQRRLADGLTEVRGIYLPQSLHAELKAKAAAMLKKATKGSCKA